MLPYMSDHCNGSKDVRCSAVTPLYDDSESSLEEDPGIQGTEKHLDKIVSRTVTVKKQWF